LIIGTNAPNERVLLARSENKNNWSLRAIPDRDKCNYREFPWQGQIFRIMGARGCSGRTFDCAEVKEFNISR
jgi:hypothetical protein